MTDSTALHIAASSFGFIAAPFVALYAASVAAVVIHETGHALAGWWAGHSLRRIILGAKGPLRGTFAIGRIPVVICGWLQGGRTVFREPIPGRRGFDMVLAGPLAGWIAAVAGWWFYLLVDSTGPLIGKPGEIRFWLAYFIVGNLCQTFASLFPSQLQVTSGPPRYSDGWQLAALIAGRPGLSPTAAARLRSLLKKVFACFATLLSLALAVSLTVWFFKTQHERTTLRRNQGSQPFFLLLVPVIVQLTQLMAEAIRLFRKPAASAAAASVPASADPGRIELQLAFNRSDWPAALAVIAAKRESGPLDVLWQSMELTVLMASENWEASLVQSRLLAPVATEHPILIQSLVAEALALSALGRSEEAAGALSRVQEISKPEDQGRVLDEIATWALKARDRTLYALCLPHLRKLCQSFPGAITLQGTLGSLLAELGMSKEARPILNKVLKTSESLDDVGITSIFLAEIAVAEGRPSEARRHATRALRTCDSPWVQERAARILGMSAGNVSTGSAPAAQPQAAAEPAED